MSVLFSTTLVTGKASLSIGSAKKKTTKADNTESIDPAIIESSDSMRSPTLSVEPPSTSSQLTSENGKKRAQSRTDTEETNYKRKKGTILADGLDHIGTQMGRLIDP